MLRLKLKTNEYLILGQQATYSVGPEAAGIAQMALCPSDDPREVLTEDDSVRVYF